ncbi:MAG: hypothetical protein ABIO04_04080 [Ferruginibacter sp.]
MEASPHCIAWKVSRMFGFSSGRFSFGSVKINRLSGSLTGVALSLVY